MNVEFPERLSCLFQPKRYKVAHGGRGSGKSWAFAQALILQSIQGPLRVLCTREVQKSIKDSVHRLLTDQIQALGLGAHFEVLDNEIRGRNGSLFLFAGLAQHTVESIKSFEGLDRVWVEEAQVVTKRSWDVLTPTIRKAGSEIWITMNPDMETDETYKRFVDGQPEESGLSFVIQMNWTHNKWFPPVLNQERLDTLARDPENYENIWEGKPKRVSDGAIYKYEVIRLYDEKRVRNVPYDPLLRVHTVWDLGWNDAMTIGFWQRSGSEVRCIDYIEDSHHTLDWYVAQIEKRPYRWGTDFLPHDARARNTQTGKSTEEALSAMGRNVKVLEALDIEEGIRAARMMFPRVYFDQEKTGRLLECLKRYQRSINQRTMEAGGPLHDEYSHGCLVGDSLVLTEAGEVAIRDVKVGDRVWTPAGLSLVTAAGITKHTSELLTIETHCGKSLTCTPEHKLMTSRGFVRADTLRYDDRIYNGTEWQCILSRLISTAIGTGYRATITGETSGARLVRPIFTGLYGSSTTALSRLIVKFTMSMAIRSTTTLAISNASTRENIRVHTPRSASFAVNSGLLLWRPWKKPPNGIDPMRGESGTLRMQSKPGRSARGILSAARSAASSFIRLTLRAPSSAMRIAKLSRCESAVVPVYDLTVKNHGCYRASGLMVSNCDMFRYAAMAVEEMGNGGTMAPIAYKRRILA